MEVYNENKSNPSTTYQLLERGRSIITSMLGVIIMFLGVAVIFFVSSLEGSKSVKASNKDNVKLLEMWRSENPDSIYPKQMEELIKFNNKEYYFVIDEIEPETNQVVKWHFAYDGGIEYIFNDYKFYILTALAIIISVYVGYVNYVSTINKEKEKDKFKQTLTYYQDKKSKISEHTQYIPDFCLHKNKQAFEEKKREIIESADINYYAYVNGEINFNNLAKWQKKRLKKIKKIKIKRIYAADLLQESNRPATKVVLLPADQKQIQIKYLLKNLIEKTLSNALGGVVVGFGVVLGNWYLGLTYGFTVFVSFVSAIIIATDQANTTLRNRFIAKADFLNEFDNIKNKFIDKEEKEIKPAPIKQPTQTMHQEKDKSLINPYLKNEPLNI